MQGAESQESGEMLHLVLQRHGLALRGGQALRVGEAVAQRVQCCRQRFRPADQPLRPRRLPWQSRSMNGARCIVWCGISASALPARQPLCARLLPWI